jgi:UDP-N-acetylmuramyl pentapeptide phosphotransferase/UDP-N-acetylglucosamine-1-phosphate transferase
VTTQLRRRLLVVVLAAGVGRAAADVVRRSYPGGAHRWQRSNYRQRSVDLAGGPAAASGVLAALIAARTPAAAIATATAAGLGLYDDLAGHTHARGLRGHATALRRGVVTSGVVKMVGLVGAGLLTSPTRPRRVRAVVADVVLVAGCANLVNLLDLRPGRALKVALAVAAPMSASAGAAGDTAAAVSGVCLALLPADLSERDMLGDCGANALGAALGWALAARLHGSRRLLAVATVTGLTVASERVSFTRVIEKQPMLSTIDRWGRRVS